MLTETSAINSLHVLSWALAIDLVEIYKFTVKTVEVDGCKLDTVAKLDETEVSDKRHSDELFEGKKGIYL